LKVEKSEERKAYAESTEDAEFAEKRKGKAEKKYKSEQV